MFIAWHGPQSIAVNKDLDAVKEAARRILQSGRWREAEGMGPFEVRITTYGRQTHVETFWV